MFEFIGWFLFLLLGLGFSVFGPLTVLSISALGGGVKKSEFVPLAVMFLIGLFILYIAYLNAPFSIVFN